MTADAAGGVWRYSVDLIKAAVKHGAEVMLATMGPRPTAAQRDELLSILQITLAESDYALEWMPGAGGDVDASGKWLLELESHFDADLIHLNGYAHASLPWGKPVVVVAHSCVYSWWRAVHGCAPGKEWTEYKKRVTDGLEACDIAVTPSAAMAAELQREYAVNTDRVRVIRNFTNVQPSSGTTKEPFVLAAGRVWDAAKNLELLDRTAPKLGWQVRIAGSGSPNRSARFLGCLAHTELMNQMRAAGIFAHPALYEPFGLSVLEAARARCCLVLSDIRSLRELWEGAARFVNPREPEAWIDEINALIHNPEERELFGKRAHSRSLEYTEASSAGQYWNLYSSIIDARSGVAA